MDAELRLIEPSEAMRDEFIADREEFRDAGEPVPADDLSGARRDFSLVVKRWADAALGKGLREGIVPWHTYWLVRGGRILGTARLRHRLPKGRLRLEAPAKSPSRRIVSSDKDRRKEASRANC